MPNEIDTLMSLDPLELSAQDIDSIILYHRKARLAFNSGVKPKRGGGADIPINLEKLGMIAKPVETIKRRKI